jgi:hypothetical protein
MVAERLSRLGVNPTLCDAEVAAMDPVHVGRTEDRSVLGSLVDFAKAVPHYLPIGWGPEALTSVEAQLAQTPCRVTGPFEDTVFPYQAAPQLLEAKWQ